MTNTDQKHMHISIDGETYSVPLRPLDPRDPALDVSFKGSGPATWRIPVFANGKWYQIPLWQAAT
jgi:hypothetical protein